MMILMISLCSYLQVEPPQTTSELKMELERLRDERLLKRRERLGLPATKP